MKELETHAQEAQGGGQMPRREFIRKSVMLSGAAFVGMTSSPRMAVPNLNSSSMPILSASHVIHGNNGVGNGEDPQPPGDPPINDGPGTGPGDPGNRGGNN